VFLKGTLESIITANMTFKKTASFKFLGILNQSSWNKTASKQPVESFYMNKVASDLVISLEETLDKVADIYKISRDPSDYLLIPARANSIGRLNANLDGWTFSEINSFRPELGFKTYETYKSKPHFVEHNANNYELSRGLILDAHLNLDNDASDQVKDEVFNTIGEIPTKDGFVETLIAMDQTKDRTLAEAYKSGAIDTFSMGADVTSTTCNICGHTASTELQFCSHVRDKFRRLSYKMDDGSMRLAGELCNGTIFQELSVVSDPADKTAVIQEGLLHIQKAASGKLTDVQSLASFATKYAHEMPESLVVVVNNLLSSQMR
jgi:hypothetical protein